VCGSVVAGIGSLQLQQQAMARVRAPHRCHVTAFKGENSRTAEKSKKLAIGADDLGMEPILRSLNLMAGEDSKLKWKRLCDEQ
jgi:hypothetical protein